MVEKPRSTLFDYSIYGVFLRSARQRAGYNRAEDFCRIVSEWTGVSVNKETLYRIEKGTQPPPVEQLIAFGLILYNGRGMQDVIDKTKLLQCMTPYAEYLASFKGQIYNALTFEGGVLDHLASSEGHLEFTVPDPDTPGLNSIDEYYYEAVGEF